MNALLKLRALGRSLTDLFIYLQQYHHSLMNLINNYFKKREFLWVAKICLGCFWCFKNDFSKS